jgi:cell division protein FtsW (lipid II flippase)
MKDSGGIIGVGILAILCIIVGVAFGLPPNISRGLILVGISIILFIVAGATWSHSWIVGLVCLCGGVAAFLIGVNAFLQPESSSPATLLAIIESILPI